MLENAVLQYHLKSSLALVVYALHFGKTKLNG